MWQSVSKVNYKITWRISWNLLSLFIEYTALYRPFWDFLFVPDGFLSVIINLKFFYYARKKGIKKIITKKGF